MDTIKKVLITRQARRFFLRSVDNDVHTQYGFIKKNALQKARDGQRLTSNTGKEFCIFTPFFIDAYSKIKRNAQIIPLKDVGFIVAETGINKKSLAVDAGAGSGALACFLGNIAKKVVTYDIREDFIEIVKRNIELLGLRNVAVKNRDIYKGIDERNVDVVTLDVPEPWLALESCSRALKAGGFIVSYSPSVPQMSDFVNSIKKREDFAHVKTAEIIEREWEVEDRRVRPKSTPIGHSGFLSIARRI